MTPDRFEIHVPDERLADLHDRLTRTRLAPDHHNNGWRVGVPSEVVADWVARWKAFDWRSTERQLNRVDHYRAEISRIPVHYLVRPGRGTNPMPLLLCHGWPWTFWDWAATIDPLADPAASGGDLADAFDVVVVSLPGFTFSTPQPTEVMGYSQMADVLAELMTGVLGYDRFAAAGGDIGNMICGALGHKYADRLYGIHLLGALPPGGYTGAGPRGPDFGLDPPRKVPTDSVLLAPPRSLRLGQSVSSTSAHMLVHAIEPQTIAAAMHDSPAGLLAYLLHRRFWWSHNDGDVLQAFTADFLLTSFSLYWFSDCFASSVRTYHDMIFHPWRPVHDRRPIVETPTGITFFAHDLTSQNRIWCAEYYNLIRTSEREGGHFAPAEVPATVVEEIRETFRPLRPRHPHQGAPDDRH